MYGLVQSKWELGHGPGHLDIHGLYLHFEMNSERTILHYSHILSFGSSVDGANCSTLRYWRNNKGQPSGGGECVRIVDGTNIDSLFDDIGCTFDYRAACDLEYGLSSA